MLPQERPKVGLRISIVRVVMGCGPGGARGTGPACRLKAESPFLENAQGDDGRNTDSSNFQRYRRHPLIQV